MSPVEPRSLERVVEPFRLAKVTLNVHSLTKPKMSTNPSYATCSRHPLTASGAARNLRGYPPPRECDRSRGRPAKDLESSTAIAISCRLRHPSDDSGPAAGTLRTLR